MNTIKMIVCGDGAVGKTSLMKRMAGTLKPDETVHMTPGVAVHSITFDSNGNLPSCICFDLGGQEHFRFVQHKYIQGATLAIFMYSVEWFYSLHDIDDWMKLVHQHAVPTQMFLVANKVDSPRRVLYDSDGKEYAEQRGMAFHEVSATTGQGVPELMKSIQAAIVALSSQSDQHLTPMVPGTSIL